MNISSIPPAVISPLQSGASPASSHADSAVAAVSAPSNPANQQPGSSQESPRHDAQKVKDAAKKLNEFVSPYASELKFSVDDDTGVNVVKVIDTQSKQVIRQIPSEEMLKIADSIEKLQGLLVRQTA